jgi:hypothetical protein
LEVVRHSHAHALLVLEDGLVVVGGGAQLFELFVVALRERERERRGGGRERERERERKRGLDKK